MPCASSAKSSQRPTASCTSIPRAALVAHGGDGDADATLGHAAIIAAMHDDPAEPLRADTWLWTSRLAKTRALAVEAIKGGKVAVNGARIKPSRPIKVGDRIELTTGPTRLEVIVKGSAKRRLPAAEAVLLYEETPESVAAREAHRAQRRLAAEPQFDRGGRPTKRDRRRIEQALGKQQRGRRR